MTDDPKPSMKDICQYIIDTLPKSYPNLPPITAKQLFRYSPTGELYGIFLLYELAKGIESGNVSPSEDADTYNAWL